MLWNITTVTQEMEKRTLLWGSSSTRKWRSPRLLWKEYADLTLFEYSVSASGKHQSLFALQFAVHLSATARLFVTGNEIKRGSREKEIDIQIHCCGFVSSLLHTHILPLAGIYILFVCYFSSTLIRLHRIAQQHGHVAPVCIISFPTCYGIRRVAHPITLCATEPPKI